MPSGYIVTLGDRSLDAGDAISGAFVAFTEDSAYPAGLGTGDWTWSGTVGGTTYTNEVEPGVYWLADDGSVYFVPDFGMVDTISSASALAPPSYTAPNGTYDGTAGNDTIVASSTDSDGDKIDSGATAGPTGNTDIIHADAGDDSVAAGLGNDVVYAGSGNDTVFGGGGDDTIYGDTDPNEGSLTPVSITASNYADTVNGFTVTAQNVVGGTLSSQSVSNISTDGSMFGANGTVSDTDSSMPEQTAYDVASGLSEKLIVDFDNPVYDLSFTIWSLQTTNFAEVGHYALYDNGTLVYEADFIDSTGTGNDTIDVNGHGAFDQIVFTALIQSDQTDGSDFGISDITYTPTTLAAQPGDDYIDGGHGDDLIDGGPGTDTLIGGVGADTVNGEAGDDLIYGDYDASDTPSAGFNHYYAAPAYVIGQNFSVTTPNPGGGPEAEEINISDDPLIVRFTDNDSAIDGDNIGNEVADDLDQTIEVNGVEYNYAVDYSLQYTDANNVVYTFYMLDLDLDGNGLMDHDSDGGNNNVMLQVGGPTLPAGTDLTIVPNGLAGVNSLSYDTFDDLSAFNFDDSLAGGSGNDTIDGGLGEDTLTGGDGSDVFIADGSADTITDFDATTDIETGIAADQTNNDFVDLSGFYNPTTLAAWNSANPSQSYATPLDWLRADQADNGTLDQAGGLQILSSGVAIDDSNLHVENTAVVCFAQGTKITTRNGDVAIEDLNVGDLVFTLDHGYQALRWIGSRHINPDLLESHENLRPIRLAKEVFGLKNLDQDLLVSPQHRILVSSKVTQRMFNCPEVLVAAKRLLPIEGIEIAHDLKEITYYHILFDNHEVVLANGIPAESLYLGAQAQLALTPEGQKEILTLFPEVGFPGFCAGLCRPTVANRRLDKAIARIHKNKKPLFDIAPQLSEKSSIHGVYLSQPSVSSSSLGS